MATPGTVQLLGGERLRATRSADGVVTYVTHSGAPRVAYPGLADSFVADDPHPRADVGHTATGEPITVALQVPVGDPLPDAVREQMAKILLTGRKLGYNLAVPIRPRRGVRAAVADWLRTRLYPVGRHPK